jgi:hypothetical protein
MPSKKCNANNCITPHSKTPTRGKRRKVTFGRSLDLESPSPDVPINKRQSPKFTPNSPLHAVIRSPHRTGNKATCILFGPFHESIYSGFFCANCKSYEDATSAGYGRKVKQNSARFKCTANHTDFMFPTDKLLVDIDDIKRKSDSVEDVSCDEESVAESQTSMNTEDELLKDLMVYTGALIQCESVSRVKLSEQFQYILRQQEDQLAAEASAANDL